MKEATKQIVSRVELNIAKTDNAKAKDDLRRLAVSLIELIIDEEPKIIDPKTDPELKGTMFFKALGRLALSGGEAWMQRDFIDPEKNPFFIKIKKFMELEDILERYSA